LILSLFPPLAFLHDGWAVGMRADLFRRFLGEEFLLELFEPFAGFDEREKRSMFSVEDGFPGGGGGVGGLRGGFRSERGWDERRGSSGRAFGAREVGMEVNLRSKEEGEERVE